MRIKRLNMDSSWHITAGATSFIMDPWLVGSEVDGFTWLNEQWHIVDPVKIDDLPEYEFIVITQSYEDHCHLATLRLLPESKPILATAKAYKRLKSKFPDRSLHLIPDGGGSIEWKGLTFTGFRPKKLLDPVYFSMSVKTVDNASIFYAPHGFTLSESQLRQIEGDNTKLLITTFTDFRLPEILGGHVNPGLENAALLHEQLNPEKVIHTHDEQKKMKGLVARYAKVEYPDYGELSNSDTFNFIHVDDYQPLEL